MCAPDLEQGWDTTLRINFVRRRDRGGNDRDARGSFEMFRAKRSRGPFPEVAATHTQWVEPLGRQLGWQPQVGALAPQALAIQQTQAAQMQAMQLQQVAK